MTRSLGRSLSQALVERFAQRDLARRLGAALPFVTTDAQGRPHPMLLSYLEIRAYTTRTVGLVIGARTRSATNLAERRTELVMLDAPSMSELARIILPFRNAPQVHGVWAGAGELPLT